MQKIKLRLLLVTDPMDIVRSYDLDHNDSEGYNKVIVEKMVNALSDIADEVIHCDNLLEFASLAKEMRDVVVLPAYFGHASPNTKAIVPSVCEAYGLPYIGADAYTQTLCNDKYLSKLYAKELGLRSSRSVLIRNKEDIGKVNRLNFPIIVKPNFGGGSNGITQMSVFDEPFAIEDHICRMLTMQKVPILAEEYMEGYEVQVIFARLADGTLLSGQFSIRLENKDYFTHEVFGLEVKKRKEGRVSLGEVTVIDKKHMKVLEKIYLSFPSAGIMRIDCRVTRDGVPWLIELSPDCSLSYASGTKRLFEKRGYSYPEMMQQLIGFSQAGRQQSH